ncbi:hypothetical protein DIS24_g12164 [Lasiodiplodia hormozganensis]|uniref:Uncharacterized protein n=1 Tax=Lasiodiplodia hormozganensis TaxID=869390 RepID=A0AA39WAG8_9PEZI|nr:hypothetical protein DIS24_g12164 [Lasiodiplodia hormozganensis]
MAARIRRLRNELKAGPENVTVERVQEDFNKVDGLYGRAKLDFVPILEIAARTGRVDIIQTLLYNGCELSAPIYQAAVNGGSTAVFEAFLQSGQWEINYPCMKDDQPVLGFVCKDLTLTNWFFENGADPNIMNSKGVTPLSKAVGDAPSEMVEYFIQHGGLVDRGWLFNYAVRRDSEEIEVVDILVRHLKILKSEDMGEVVKCLNRVEYDGHFDDCHIYNRPFTPLNEAVANGKEALVRHLISKGADPNTPDGWNRNALEWAEQLHPELEDVIKNPLG